MTTKSNKIKQNQTSKNLLVCFISLSFFMYLLSCQKSEVIITDFVKASDTSSEDQQYLASYDDVFHLIELNADNEEVNLNYCLYYMSLCLEEIIKSKTNTELILNEAMQDAGYEVSFEMLSELSPEINSTINSILNFYSKEFGVSNLQELSSKMKTHDIEYYPVIYVPNAEKADADLYPVISPGVQVEDDITKNRVDHYFAWLYNDDFNKTNISIGEEQAYSTNHPVFMVANKTDWNGKEYIKSIGTKENRNISIPIKVNNSYTSYKANTTYPLYATYHYQFNHTYENTGNIEYANARSLYVSGTVLYLDGEEWDVDRDLVDIMLTRWSGIMESYPDLSCCNAMFNTYEYDWGTALKNLYQHTNLASATIQSRRKQFHEWYTFDPADHNFYDFEGNCPNDWNTDMITNDESKGYTEMWNLPY